MRIRASVPLIIWTTSIALLVIALTLTKYVLAANEAGDQSQIITYLGIVCLYLLIMLFYALGSQSGRAELQTAAATEELVASNELFYELYRNSPVPYLRIKRGGQIVSANNAALRLFKVKEGQLEGTDLFALIGVEDEVRVSLIPTEISRGLFVNDEEIFLNDSNGARHWTLLSAFPYGHENERLITLFDITKQKEIDIAKSEFVSLASHQLRTPISAMKWNLELLHSDKVGALNENQTKYLQKIERNAEKMHLLIQDFLDASQLEMGTFATDSVDISVPEFLSKIYEEFDVRVERKRLTLTRDYSETPVSIHTDEHLLHNVISNLVSNAVKYTPEDGTVTVGFKTTGTNAVFSIADTGMGIPKAEQDNLFSKFFRASNARSEVTEGTGLGLYIVAQAVEKLGGTITVESETNAGTTFTVTIPSHLK